MEENYCLLIAGRQGSGKTTQVKKIIQEHISASLKALKPWRVVVISTTTDEYLSEKRMKPVLAEKESVAVNYKTVVCSPENLYRNPELLHFTDGLIVFDCGGSISQIKQAKEVALCMATHRHRQQNIIYVQQSLGYINPPQYGAFTHLQLHRESSKPHEVQTYLPEHMELIKLCKIFVSVSENNPYQHIKINLINNTIDCNEYEFVNILKTVILSKILLSISMSDLKDAARYIIESQKYFQSK